MRIGFIALVISSLAACHSGQTQTDTHCPDTVAKPTPVPAQPGAHVLTFVNGEATAMLDGEIVQVRWRNGEIERVPLSQIVKEFTIREGNKIVTHARGKDGDFRQHSSLTIVE